MYLYFDVLNRKTNNRGWPYDMNLSEEEMISIYSGIRDGIPYDEIDKAPEIKARIADYFNSFNKKKVTADDISFYLSEMDERAARGMTDVVSFLNHKDSMILRRNDGSTVSFHTERGLVYFEDSRKKNCINQMTVDTFLECILH